jgi:hypothetical protein
MRGKTAREPASPGVRCNGIITARGVTVVRDWEEQFREWAKPPGKTEQDRCGNGVSAIRNCLLRDLMLMTSIHDL